MKKSLLILTIAGSLAFVASSFTNSSPESIVKSEAAAPELKWHTDFQKANKLSEKTGKPIFAFFTGSDWCGWCKRLQAAVFVKEDFKKWADESVILLELDFPRRTTLPAELKKQNRELAQLFKIKGYPTVWIFKPVTDTKTNQTSINALGKLSYPRAESGKESQKFISDANAILAKGK